MRQLLAMLQCRHGLCLPRITASSLECARPPAPRACTLQRLVLLNARQLQGTRRWVVQEHPPLCVAAQPHVGLQAGGRRRCNLGALWQPKQGRAEQPHPGRQRSWQAQTDCEHRHRQRAEQGKARAHGGGVGGGGRRAGGKAGCAIGPQGRLPGRLRGRLPRIEGAAKGG